MPLDPRAAKVPNYAGTAPQESPQDKQLTTLGNATFFDQSGSIVIMSASRPRPNDGRPRREETA